jgi:hypothetical protein
MIPSFLYTRLKLKQHFIWIVMGAFIFNNHTNRADKTRACRPSQKYILMAIFIIIIKQLKFLLKCKLRNPQVVLKHGQ